MKERDIKKWNAALDRAVNELRALGVEPSISPAPWMQWADAYKKAMRDRFARLRAGGPEKDEVYEKEGYEAFSSLIDLMGPYKSNELVDKIRAEVMKEHFELRYGKKAE